MSSETLIAKINRESSCSGLVYCHGFNLVFRPYDLPQFSQPAVTRFVIKRTKFGAVNIIFYKYPFKFINDYSGLFIAFFGPHARNSTAGDCDFLAVSNALGANRSNAV